MTNEESFTETLDSIAKKLSSYGITSYSEAVMQASVEHILTLEQLKFWPEKFLSKTERIDFLVEGDIGIECKINGSTISVTRQLLRYARTEMLNGIILVTTRCRHRAIPATLYGCAVRVVYIGSFL